MSETELTMEFARRDDCLDRMVPSDLRLLIRERDDLRDRLAAIERQVLWRTEDMPDYARAWFKLMDGECWWVNLHPTDGIQEGDAAPDYRPDEAGPLFLPILDPPEGS